MKEIEDKKFEIKSIDYNSENKELIIKGYASIFGDEDTPQYTWNPEIQDWVIAVDVIEKGAFTKTLSERKGRIASCLNHYIDNAIGKIKELKEDEIGLYFEIRISDAESELKTKLREGIYSEMSFGFKTIRAEFEKKTDGTYIRRVKEVILYEISVVTVARNENAKITEVKSEEFNNILENLIIKEKDHEKKYQLLQLKSLIVDAPSMTPINNAPNKDVEESEIKSIIRKSLN